MSERALLTKARREESAGQVVKIGRTLVESVRELESITLQQFTQIWLKGGAGVAGQKGEKRVEISVEGKGTAVTEWRRRMRTLVNYEAVLTMDLHQGGELVWLLDQPRRMRGGRAIVAAMVEAKGLGGIYSCKHLHQASLPVSLASVVAQITANRPELRVNREEMAAALRRSYPTSGSVREYADWYRDSLGIEGEGNAEEEAAIKEGWEGGEGRLWRQRRQGQNREAVAWDWCELQGRAPERGLTISGESDSELEEAWDKLAEGWEERERKRRVVWGQ